MVRASFNFFTEKITELQKHHPLVRDLVVISKIINMLSIYIKTLN